MKEQTIIVISREFGSGGRDLANALAEHYHLPLYDDKILVNIAREKGLDADMLTRYDESPRNFFLSRSVRGFNNSPSENIFQIQFRYLREMAKNGDSFVVLGRCGDEILRDFDPISIFVLADIDFKKGRTMKKHQLQEAEALEMMARMDLKRKYYHNQHCRGKWGDSRSYDLCVNSARLDIPGTFSMLVRYIDDRIRVRREKAAAPPESAI